MNIRVTLDAAADLEQIKVYIGRENSAAAERVVHRIQSTIAVLARWPHFGHVGIVRGTYERSVSRTPYVIVYRLDIGEGGEELVVVRVPHVSQDRARQR